MLKRLSGRYTRLNMRMVTALSILILIAVIGSIVYITGGTAAAFTHLMYIPIVLSAFYFSIGGAAATALLSGSALGPWMPANVIAGTRQDPVSWVLRTVMFLAIGMITAVLFKSVRNFKEAEIRKSFQNMVTGLPNSNQLKLDLTKMIDKKTGFSLIGFRVVNIDDINRYAGYEIGINAILQAIELFTACISRTVYSIFTHEFAAILPDSSGRDPRSVGMEFLNQLKIPLSVNQFRIELILQGGIVRSPLKDANSSDLLKKMGIALGQEANGTGLAVYDSLMEQRNSEKYELIVSLSEAIKSNEFFIVYQPKQCLDDNSVMGVEALLRWDHRHKGRISPAIFIKTAEEIGLISDITRWVIKNVIRQINQWLNEGISVKVAINISARDLRDHTVIDYLKKSVEENFLDPGMIELELTESCILNNVKTIGQFLNELREYGIRISLDDFGTGYNSLIDLVKIPVDFLKIDKAFIDNISDDVNRAIIETVIACAHRTGKKVIAEGVETKEQLELLKKMGCDCIQGYYFSKPLPPEAIKEMYLADPR